MMQVLAVAVVGSLSRIRLFAAPWTAAFQAPLSMGFSRQEYWSGLPFPPPGDLPNPGIEPASPALAGRFFTTEPPEMAYQSLYIIDVHNLVSLEIRTPCETITTAYAIKTPILSKASSWPSCLLFVYL